MISETGYDLRNIVESLTDEQLSTVVIVIFGIRQKHGDCHCEFCEHHCEFCDQYDALMGEK